MNAFDLVLTPTHVRFRNRRYPCTIGRGLVSDHKAEGDGATPVGTHKITGLLYRPDRITKPTRWSQPIHPRDLWSDDPHHADYNHKVRAPYPYSHEALRRADPLYDLVLLTDWNWPVATPGHGSAIFLHQQRRPGYPTEGCIAFNRAHLRDIAKHITPQTRLIVPQSLCK